MRPNHVLTIPALLSLVAAPAGADPEAFEVRDGYRVTVAVDDLPGARFMAFDDRGVLYVTRPRPGDIATFHDPDGDGAYEPLGTFVTGRRSTHGIQFFDGWVWFTTSDAVWRGRDTDADGEADEVVEVVGGLPSGGGHWWRSLLVTPEGFYTSVGDSGNITDEADSERQKIWRFDLDGSNKRLFCSGIRNTEKLRLRPGTDEVWGFDHGSDWFGREVGDDQRSQPITDLNPPDELNRYVQGGFYGHPFVVGPRLPRYEYMGREDIHELAARTIAPEWQVGAHWACNGWTFVESGPGDGAIPAEQSGDIYVACHGSWNSSQRVGYCVARVLFDAGRPYGLLKVVSTAGEDGQVHARPADVVQAPDGSLLFSDDHGGRVYRIEHTGE